MFRLPDVYKVGMSVAPVPGSEASTTRSTRNATWGCRQENAKGYRDGSPINFAAGLRGELLVVHGSGDDNVHYQGTERLINRLVELGKPFDVMVYPNRTHAFRKAPARHSISTASSPGISSSTCRLQGIRRREQEAWR